MADDGHFKDQVLDTLAIRANVAQFVSFDPGLNQRFAWIRGHEPNAAFGSLAAAVEAILASAPEGSVNIRSFEPHDPKSREFIYGRKTADSVLADLRRLAGEGLYTIVNETVDVDDGGVSGVSYGNVVEFAPGDTPRAVEKPGTAALTRDVAERVFRTVYGFAPALPDRPELRVEFSIHPLRRGYRHDHTIVWEIEELAEPPTEADIGWPNLFSRMLGDKAYGLLVAHALGLRVPHTRAFPRRVAPFSFGNDTGLAEPWIRTCPTVQQPGRFTTRRGWLDPYQLMQEEDPEGTAIASILAQQGVDAKYSGALISQPDGEPLVEGVAGFGDPFMVGEAAPEELPAAVVEEVLEVYRQASSALGPVRFEWVHDGREVWIVQLHKGASATSGRVIFPGEAERFHRFDVSAGIGALRELIARIDGSGEGVVLVGRVGVTSHFGDLLRRARVPSRIEEPAE
ncbi:MAG TPA: hypothetical protein VHG28_22640 [Longimicrobiaceae bacterium]|nr:hypothetical protein [Longimicrobiaceae bacterium]